MKGSIFLDIDGTVTDKKHMLNDAVVEFLHTLEKDGWQLIFVTGRSFSWGWQPLKVLKFPFYFAVQNGSAILKMPEKKVIKKHYLKKDILPIIEPICHDKKTGFVIYSGFETDDICYYKPKHFIDKEHFAYLTARKMAIKEIWHPLTEFSEIPLDEFASFKFFGIQETLESIARELLVVLDINMPVITDAHNKNHYVGLGTHKNANKGAVVQEIKMMYTPEVTIACGDDFNDESMLKNADIKVVMESAPKEILKLADIIAPPAVTNGIIKGLKGAIELVKQRSI